MIRMEIEARELRAISQRIEDTASRLENLYGKSDDEIEQIVRGIARKVETLHVRNNVSEEVMREPKAIVGVLRSKASQQLADYFADNMSYEQVRLEPSSRPWAMGVTVFEANIVAMPESTFRALLKEAVKKGAA